LKLLFTVVYFSSELGYIAEHLNIDHTSMGFVGNCVKKVLTVNSILDILSKAPVFSNIEVSIHVVQYVIFVIIIIIM
jgi:hypothetical protein